MEAIAMSFQLNLMLSTIALPISKTNYSWPIQETLIKCALDDSLYLKAYRT